MLPFICDIDLICILTKWISFKDLINFDNTNKKSSKLYKKYKLKHNITYDITKYNMISYEKFMKSLSIFT